MTSGKRIRQVFLVSASLTALVLLLSSCGGPPAGGSAERAETVDKIDWGRETTAGQVIEMARRGEIREIEWHVMPNILRAVASDGRVFHIRNENKGIDLRTMLIKAGVQVGKGGVDFRHVF